MCPACHKYSGDPAAPQRLHTVREPGADAGLLSCVSTQALPPLRSPRGEVGFSHPPSPRAGLAELAPLMPATAFQSFKLHAR